MAPSPGPAPRLARVVLVAAVLSIATASRGDDRGTAEEYERPFTGWVPAETGVEGAEPWTKVVAGDTGRPIRGARLILHEESCWEGDLVHWPVLGVGESDEEGIAHVDLATPESQNHWVIAAPGYASQCEFGLVPPPLVVLERGEPVAFRVTDPFGDPAPGVAVEWFDGCSHSPPLASGTTDAQGIVRLDPVDPSRGRYWLSSPLGAREPVDSLFVLGERMPVVALDPGVRPHGVVVDRIGNPVRALVRNGEQQRGPAVLTDERGRFLLPAIEAGASLWVRGWDHTGDHVPMLDDVDLRWPQRIVLDPQGVVETPWKGARLRVAARVADAMPRPEFIPVRVVRESDGAAKDVQLEPTADGSGGFLRILDVAPGAYRVLPVTDGSHPERTDRARATVEAGATADVLLSLRNRPRLRVTSDVPKGARVSLITPDRELRLDPDSATYLRADARASVRASDDLGGLWWFPVGPPVDGERRVAVSIPAPHRIRWPAGTKVRDVELLLRGREQRIDERSDGLDTRATGDLVLSVQVSRDDARIEIPVRLPDGPGVEIVVDPRTGAPATTPTRLARYRVVAPKDAPRAPSVSASGSYISISGAGDGAVVEAEIGSTVTATLDGYRPIRILVTKVEDREIRWGTASLDLEVVDADGDPADARVLLDDEPVAAKDGRLSMKGLDAGPHRVRVAPPGGGPPGRELRLVLKDGEHRARRVTLPPE